MLKVSTRAFSPLVCSTIDIAPAIHLSGLPLGHYHCTKHSSKQTPNTAAAPTPNFPVALDGKEVEATLVAAGVPVAGDEPLVVGVVESVPLAFENWPVYLVCCTPLPLVHSELAVLVLEKVMSAHCTHC